RADIAFVCLAKPTAPAAEGRTIATEAPRRAKAPKLAGLCARGSSESRRIYTISSGAVANLWKTASANSNHTTSEVGCLPEKGAGPQAGEQLMNEASEGRKASLRADPLSFARRPLPFVWPRPQLFRHRCWRRRLCRQHSSACCSRSVNRGRTCAA